MRRLLEQIQQCRWLELLDCGRLAPSVSDPANTQARRDVERNRALK